MLDTPAEAGDEIHKQREKRDAARDRVARALAARSWNARRHRIMDRRHYCHLGCHDSEQAAKEEAAKLAAEAKAKKEQERLAALEKQNHRICEKHRST